MDAGMPAEGIGGVMMAFEHSGLGQAARSTGWLYPLANLVHVLGAALVVGAIATFDIQVLRSLREASIVSRTAIRIAVVGLSFQAGSGVVLLSAEASTLVRNPAFQFKMAMLVLALTNVAVFHWRFGRALKTGAALGDGARPLAVVSLASWILVLLAGRSIAYL
jgi:hypothetical protein